MLISGLMFFIIDNPSISGYAVGSDPSQNALSNIAVAIPSTGYYAANPSFITTLDYDIGEYAILEGLIRKKYGFYDIVKEKELQGGSLDEAILFAIDAINARLDHNLNFNFGACKGDENLQKTTSNIIEERTRRFCVKSKTYLPYFDPEKKSFTYKQIEYKFALYFPDNVPPTEVKGISTRDFRSAENKIILSWSKNQESDVAGYELYYSKDSISSLKVDSIESSTSIFKQKFAEKDKIIFNSFDLDQNPSCIKDGLHCKFYYLADGKNVQLDAGKTYYINDKETYFIVLEIEDDAVFEFGVNAYDFSKNKRDNDKLKISFYKGSSIDDLGPINIFAAPGLLDKFTDKIKVSVQKPDTNIDNSTLLDIEDFYVFTSDSEFSSLNGLNNIYSINLESNGCYIISLVCDLYIPLSVLPQGKFYLALAGADEKGNYYKDTVFPLKVENTPVTQ